MADEISTAYRYAFGPHQTLYIGGKGLTTLVSFFSGGPGQQQQSSGQFSTGKWTAVPLLYRLSDTLVVIVIATLSQTYYVQVRSSATHLGATGAAQSQMQAQIELYTGGIPPEIEVQIAQSRPIPLEPVEAMPEADMRPLEMSAPMTMKMGDMEMRMGDMEMRMGDISSASTSTASTRSVSSTSGHTHSPRAWGQATGSQSQQSSQVSASSQTAGDTTHSRNTVRTSSGSEDSPRLKRFCTQCGGAIEPGDRFCGYCGAQLA